MSAAPRCAWAGAQVEEPLADAVRLALSAAVADQAPPRPQFADTDRRLAYLRWLSDSSERLRKRITELFDFERYSAPSLPERAFEAEIANGVEAA